MHFSLSCLVAIGLLAVSNAAASDFENSLLPLPGLSEVFEQEPSVGLLAEPLGAERIHSEDDLPRIPEPMVFDLVRGLGAKKGEMEINTLGLVPLNRRARGSEIPDSIGVINRDRNRMEWAPEIEAAIADGVAIEFELPFEETRLDAYKGAAQFTFGTAFDDHFIHGAQGILIYDKTEARWEPALLYLFGFIFDEHWSGLGMFGFRTEIHGHDREERTQTLFNLTIFRHLDRHNTVGFETNTARAMNGNTYFLVMPQWHWEITDHWMLQTGIGTSFTKERSLPEVAFRLIYSF